MKKNKFSNEIKNDLYPLLAVLLSSSIISIIISIKYKLNFKLSLALFLILNVIIISPSCRTIRHLYFQCKICLLILFIMVAIILIFPYYISIPLISLIFFYYRRNFLIIYGIVTSAIISIKKKPPMTYLRDLWLRRTIKNIYTQNGLTFITNFQLLPSHPTIILANYCKDRIENPFAVLIPRKLAIMMQRGFRKINMSAMINKPIYVEGHKQGNFHNINKAVKQASKEGNDIFVYVNNPSFYDYIGKLHSGIFKIAMTNKITVTPITFDFIEVTKSGYIPSQNIFIKVGNTFCVKDVIKAKTRVRRFFIDSLEEFKQNKFTKDYNF